MNHRYQNIPVVKNDKGVRYHANNVYPDIPLSDDDIYIITTVGDRLELLADNYYKDVTLWWIIVSANNLPGDTMFIPLGMQLRIPVNISEVIKQYNLING
jgi:hypothetical protein